MPEQSYDDVRAGVLARRQARLGAGGGGQESLWQNANRPRWTQPAKWGEALGEFVEGAPAVNPMGMIRNKIAGTASRLGGQAVSQATSPVGAATLAATALSGGAAAPLLGTRMAAGAAIPAAAGRVAQGIGALEAAHGVGEIGSGIQNRNLGQVGGGVVEVGFGALGLKNPGGKPRPTTGSNVGTVGSQGLTGTTTTVEGARLPLDMGPPPLRGQTSRVPTHPRRMLPENAATPPPPPAPRIFTAGPAGVEAPSAPSLGVVEKGPGGPTYNWRGETIEPPTPGLRLDPGGRLRPQKGFSMSFPQMVDQYGLEEAAQRAGVTAAEAARLAKGRPLGKPAPKPKPKYPPPTKTGKQPKPEVVPPTVIEAAKKLQKLTQRQPPDIPVGKAPNLGGMKTAELQALAAEGNTQAADMLAKRAASSRQPTTLKERLAGAIPQRLRNEVGAAGPGAGRIIDTKAALDDIDSQIAAAVKTGEPMEDLLAARDEAFNAWQTARGVTGQEAIPRNALARGRVAQEAEEVIPSHPSSDNPDWNQSPEYDPNSSSNLKFRAEQQLAQDKQNFQRRQDSVPEKFEQDMDFVMRDNPEFTHQEAMEETFRRFRKTQQRIREQVADNWARKQPGAEQPFEPHRTLGRERPPFRPVEDAPYSPMEPSPPSTIEPSRLVANKDWYAGQETINRGQVEDVKMLGLSNPQAAARSKPYVTIDEAGNYQIHDGHHRLTVSQETGKPVDLTLEDYSPKESWFRKARGMTETESPFARAGKETARKFRGEMDEATSNELGENLYQRLVRQLGSETGAVGPNIGPMAQAQARIKQARAQAAAGGAGRGPKPPGAGQAPPPGVPKKPAGMSEKVWNAALQARMTAMLSGLAVPKSMLGNVGAHAFASLEGKSLRPLKELFNVGENVKNLKAGWKAGAMAPDANDLGFGKFNIPGRIMGAFDEASTKSLMRSGMSEKEAKEILLTAPSGFAESLGLNSPLGRLLVPFQKTPANTVKQGLTRFAKHPVIGAGTMAAGYGVGTQTEDPKKIALASALMGPYALPFLLGALPAAGEKAVQGFSPIPEWSIHKALSDPLAPFQKPGLARLFEGKGEDASLFGKEGSLRIFQHETKPKTRREQAETKRGSSGTPEERRERARKSRERKRGGS